MFEGEKSFSRNFGKEQHYVSFIQSSQAGIVPVDNEIEAKYFLETFEKELGEKYSFKYLLGDTHIAYSKIKKITK